MQHVDAQTPENGFLQRDSKIQLKLLVGGGPLVVPTDTEQADVIVRAFPHGSRVQGQKPRLRPPHPQQLELGDTERSSNGRQGLALWRAIRKKRHCGFYFVSRKRNVFSFGTPARSPPYSLEYPVSLRSDHSSRKERFDSDDFGYRDNIDCMIHLCASHVKLPQMI